jgi:deazaflavin-dependent oxidoreductase (nitroreductase family)
MLAFNRKLIEEFRANDGELSGPLAGRQLMLLTTTGARSGRPQTVVIGFRMKGDDYVVIVSANGAPVDPAWYRNLLADAKATAEVGPEKFGVRARTAEPSERGQLARLVDYFEGEQAKTSRQIPVVVLERVGR